MATRDEVQYQGRSTMASTSSSSFFLDPSGSRSPPVPTPLPVSSPEPLSDHESPHLVPSSSGITTSTPFPPTSEASLPSPKESPARSTHLAFIDSRPDLTSPTRSRSSSLRHTLSPSASHTTPPSSPLPDGTPPPRTAPPPPAEQTLAKRNSTNGHVPVFSNRTRSPSAGPLAAARRNSQDRRVRSEALAPRTSPMAHGKSASLVTGGYITSDSDSLSDRGDATARPNSARAASSFFNSRSTQLVAQERRKRAQSLMSPVSMSDHSPSGDGEGSMRSFGSGHSGKEKARGATDHIKGQLERERSQSISTARPTATLRTSHLRTNGHGNHVPQPSPLSSNAPSRWPSAHYPSVEATSSRHPSFRSTTTRQERMSSSRSPPKQSEELPARTREVDKLRREEGVSSPEGSRKGKERAHEPPAKRNALAASLAYSSRSRDTAVLTDEQIQELFSHSEIGKVARQTQAPPGSAHPPLRHDRRLSSMTDTRRSGSQHRELFTVTAPPALLHDEDGHARDRTLSISSSVAPSPSPRKVSHGGRQPSFDDDEEETEPAQRRREARRRSSTVVEHEGGHIPFTHHLPSRVNEVHESSSDEDVSADVTFEDDRPGSSMAQEAQLARPVIDSQSTPSDRKRKGRLSSLFRRSKRSSEGKRPATKSPQQPTVSHHDQAKLDHAESREQWEKSKAIQLLEQERRDAEIAEERKYEAFLEVQAHPAAATRASQVGSHLWAWYSQIYETIEDPPKLNPLAVLRFKHKTAEQDEARARYKMEQAELDKEPTSFPSVWTHQGHLSSASLGGRIKPRSTGASTKNARSSTSVKSGVASYVMAPGWHYSIDDVSRYRAAGGRVQYHMPERVIEPMPATRSVESLQRSRANRSLTGNDDFTPRVDADVVDLTSSVGSGGRQSDGHDHGGGRPIMNGNMRSMSMLSVNGAASNSPGSSRMDLARTSSIETSRVDRSPSTRRGRRQGRHHASHQSMSAIPNSIAHTIDSFKSSLNGTRRQQTLPHSGASTPQPADSGVDEPKEKRSFFHLDTPVRTTPRSSILTGPARQLTVPRHTTPLREHESHVALEGDPGRHKVVQELADRVKVFVRPRKSAATADESPSKESLVDPLKETERLSAVREAEIQFEQRTGGDHGPTERRKRAEAQLDSHEQRIYRDRLTSIMKTRERMAGFTTVANSAEDFVRLRLAHVEQLKQYAIVSAEIDVDFPGVESIQSRYSDSRRSSTNGDSAWESQPPSRRASRKSSMYGPSLVPPTYPMSTKPWPRRAVLDRQGARIDPLSQVELVLRDAGETEEGMQRSKGVARAKLQGMSQAIADFHDTKNRIRDEMEVHVDELKIMRDHIIDTERLLTARSSWWYLIESSRETDVWVDRTVRHPIAKLLYGGSVIYSVGLWAVECLRRLAWTIGVIIGVIAVLIAIVIALT